MKILLVENHPHFARAIVKEFLSGHEVVIAPSIANAKAQLLANDFDIFMSDYDLDDGKGDAFVIYLREIGNKKPIIAISSHEKGNAALMHAGATAVCSKIDFRKINDVLLTFKCEMIE